MVLRQLIDEVMFEIRKLSGQEYVDTYAGKGDHADGAERPPAPAPEPARRDEPELEPERVAEPARVLVGAGGAEVVDDGATDERPSSADVLAKWWS